MGNKLIVVADAKQAEFYKAVGLKITHKENTLHLEDVVATHKRQDLKQGFNKKGSSPSHFFDPHTEADEIERKEFGRKLTNELNILCNKEKYDELILIATPKILGEIRANLDKQLKNILTKEIAKELVGSDTVVLEQQIFG